MAFLDETGVQNLTADIKTLADQTYLPKNTSIPTSGDETPLINSGTGSPGSSTNFSRADHVHPSQITGAISAFDIIEVVS